MNLAVDGAGRKQFLMCAATCRFTVFQDQNLVCRMDGGGAL